METITKREDYAKAVNFGNYAVLMVDLGQEGFMDTIFHGSKVRVDFGTFRTGERHLGKGELCYNKKENEFYISSECIILTKDLTYEDALEGAQYGNSPIINEGDKVVIVLHDSKNRVLKAFITTAKNKSAYCSTMLTFE